MINLKVDPVNSRQAHDEDLRIHVLSRDEPPIPFIVRAVNNHDALVAMVRRLIVCRAEDGISRATALDARALLASIDQ